MGIMKGVYFSMGKKESTTYSFQKLWHLMLDQNMTKRELAQKADVSVSLLGRLRNGKLLSYERMKRICEAVGCSDLSEIMDEQRMEL